MGEGQSSSSYIRRYIIRFRKIFFQSVRTSKQIHYIHSYDNDEQYFKSEFMFGSRTRVCVCVCVCVAMMILKRLQSPTHVIKQQTFTIRFELLFIANSIVTIQAIWNIAFMFFFLHFLHPKQFEILHRWLWTKFFFLFLAPSPVEFYGFWYKIYI